MEHEMSTPMHNARTIELIGNQVLVFDDGLAEHVWVRSGAAWLTDESGGDQVLQSGAEAALGCGRTVIESLGPTRLEVSELATPRRDRWQRLRHAAGQMRQRYQFGETATSGVF